MASLTATKTLLVVIQLQGHLTKLRSSIKHTIFCLVYDAPFLKELLALIEGASYTWQTVTFLSILL